MTSPGDLAEFIAYICAEPILADTPFRTVFADDQCAGEAIHLMSVPPGFIIGERDIALLTEAKRHHAIVLLATPCGETRDRLKPQIQALLDGVEARGQE